MAYQRPQLSLMARAVGYLSRREYSRTELARKLAQAIKASQRQQQAAAALQNADDGGFETVAPNANNPADFDHPDAKPPVDSSAAINEVLDRLEQKGLLSTERFAHSIARRKGSRLGTSRVLQELGGHQIPPELLKTIGNDLKESELARATAVWQRKFGSIATDAASAAKQARFLLYRGFPSHIVMRLVRGAGMADED